MQRQGDLLRSSLTAGAIFGIVSGVPILGAINCLCCALIVGAGGTAAFLLIRSSQEIVDYGRAALAGTLAGIFAAPAWVVTSLAFTFLRGQDLQQQFAEAVERSSRYVEGGDQAAAILTALGAPILALFMLCFLTVVCAPFGLAGGVLGRAIFERRTPPPAVPPAYQPMPPPDSTIPPAAPPMA